MASIKTDEEALYAKKGKGKYRSQSSQHYKKSSDKTRNYESGKNTRKFEKREPSEDKQKNHRFNKRFPFKCHNCGCKGHMARNCRSEQLEEGNVAASQEEEAWDAEALYEQVKDEVAFSATAENSEDSLDE